MKILFALKIFGLLICFVGVVAVINRLDPKHVDKFFKTLGADQSQTGNDGASPPASSTYRLCDSRIHSMKWNDGRRIEESKDGMKLKWMAHNPEPRELSYLEIERWLSQNCDISVTTASSAGVAFSPFLTIEFVNQNLKTIYRASPNLFQIDGQVLHSTQLEQALEKLRNL